MKSIVTPPWQNNLGQNYLGKNSLDLNHLASYRQQVERQPETMPPLMEYRNETLNDRWIVEYIFPGKRQGYFIEAGAANGKDASSCYILETELDWRGICIEPHQGFFEKLLEHRPNSHCEQICLSDRSETVTYIQSDSPYMNGVKSNLEQYKWEGDKIIEAGNAIELPAVPLVDLLKKHQAPAIIDYAAFDIEGSELLVLESFPFEQYRFLALSIEADEWIWERLKPYLATYGYRSVRNPFNPDMIWEKYWLHESVLAEWS
jgi:FkbM family methyltransferase